jgi:catechol 2,3-dioxygenase-like lactoylglutathione lyase family enzyme
MSVTQGLALRASIVALSCAGLGAGAGCSGGGSPGNEAPKGDSGAADSGAGDTGSMPGPATDGGGGLPYGCSGAVDPSGRPPICNFAHYAIRHPDLTSARHFFTDFLGLAEPFQVSSTMAVFKINDSQFIEVYQEAAPAGDTNFDLKNIAFYTSDAEALRKYFGSKGVQVPAAVSKNVLGNTSFTVTDPDGHVMEWVQYEADSLTGMTQGQAMPDTRIGTSVHHFGVSITNPTASTSFYDTALGFLASSTADHPAAEDPNATVRIEYGVTHSAVTQPFAVVRDHLCFRVADVMAAYRTLESRDPTISLEHHVLLGFTVRANSYLPGTGDRFEFADSVLLPMGEDAGPADYDELDSGSTDGPTTGVTD